MSPSAISKGKAKTVEHTPLLDEHGHPAEEAVSEDQRIDAQTVEVSRLPMRQAWRSNLVTAALILFSICFAFMLGIVLLAESYAAPARRNIDRALSQPGGDKFWKEAVPMRGPDAVQVLGVGHTEDNLGGSELYVNLSVSMRMTVDTDFIMGFREGSPGTDGWWARAWKGIGRWAVRRLGSTTVTLDSVIIYPSSQTVPARLPALVTIIPLSPIPITLSPGLSSTSLSDLTSVSIPFLVWPAQNVSFLREFAENSWAQAFANVRIRAYDLQICGGYGLINPPKLWQIGRWRSWLRVQKSAIALGLKLPIPPLRLPSHPPIFPGSKLPALADLLTLESFAITTTSSPPEPSLTSHHSLPIASYSGLGGTNVNPFSKQRFLSQRESSISPTRPVHEQPRSLSDARNIILSARASLVHPFSSFASKLKLDMSPFPFIIAFPVPQPRNTSISLSPSTLADQPLPSDLVPVAQVYAAPSFNATHIQIPLSGYILPFSNSTAGLADAISAFATTYLSYQPAPIAVYSPLYPSLVVRASFPPPATRLRLLRDVKIENMTIRPGFGTIFVPDSDQELVSKSTDSPLRVLDLLASATVHARAVLPPGVDIDIEIKHVWVDCFVFDGGVPQEVSSGVADNGDTSLLEEKRPNPISDFGVLPVPEPRPLPHPLPPRAFARMTPKNWLDASSSRSPPRVQGTDDARGANGESDEDNETNVFVTAKIVDVPLEVLPGREDDLTRFITKVVFSKEAVVAGIRGTAAVGVSVPGLTESTGEGSEFVLNGLPFEGNVKIGGRK